MANDVETLGYRPALRRMRVIITALRLGRIVNATEFARQLETSPKSIHRDIEFLRWSLGFEIVYDRSKFGYVFVDNGTCPFCHAEGIDIAMYSFRTGEELPPMKRCAR